MNIPVSTLNLILVTNILFLPIIVSDSRATQSNCPPIEQGVAFLEERYNPTLGLLNESPLVAPEKYWLTNDNALAAFTFSQLSHAEMSSTLISSLERYGYPGNGLIDVIWGAPITYPPYVENNVMVARIGDNEIWQEFHNQGSHFTDWAEYANLAFLGVLNEYYQGRPSEAHSIYNETLSQFDGAGFHDKAFKDEYETYKLALALYVGSVLEAPNPNREQMLAILQSMQSTNGGFYTHYLSIDVPRGDTNTETTSLSLLALKTSLCEANLSNLDYTGGTSQHSIINEERR